MRHAGVHWPENAGGEHPDVETILRLPGIARGCTVICSPSARFWYDEARSRCPLVIWRAIPRQGRLPAELGWDANPLADECLTHWDEQAHGGAEWFLPLNELQASHENGGPFPGYGLMAENLGRLRLQLRRKFTQKYPGSDVRLMFPAWAPSDDGDHLRDWQSEAAQWDAIAVHAYGPPQIMKARYLSYRTAFPNHQIVVIEWNSPDDRGSLEMWAGVARSDPKFLGAAYYIWETNNAGEERYSIWGNPDRLKLFQNPPELGPPTPQGSGMFDLVISPGNIPSLTEIEELQPRKIRSILKHVSDCEQVANLGLPYIATVNNECAEVGGNWSGWDQAIQQISDLDRPPWAVEIGNEFDLFWQHNELDVPPGFAASLIRRAFPILHSRGIKVIATSVASARWPEYLQRLAALSRDYVDYFNIHPYGQRPEGWGRAPWMHGELRSTILQAHVLAGKTIYCTEIGVKIGDAGGEEEVGEWMLCAAKTLTDLGPQVCAGGAWFAWRDQVGAPEERGDQAFGLRAEDGFRRPAWFSFAALNEEDDVEDPEGIRFQLGFKEWADAEPDLIGEAVENEAGGIPGMSQQLTSNGLLTWCNLVEGQAMTFYEFSTQTRHVRGQ